jgi:Amt family ammonium transporter
VFSILAFDKLKIDDPVGAISVHGVVGMWGLMAVPLTAPGTTFGGQFVGLLTIFVWVFVASFITWYVIKMIMFLSNNNFIPISVLSGLFTFEQKS